MNERPRLNLPWIARMAWRDSRSYRKRLLLYMSSIVVGTGALVAITNLGASMAQAVDDQARTLLGADVAFSSRRPFSDEVERIIAATAGERARQTRFSSMVYFPKTEGTRLTQVRAAEGSFPFYGELLTRPRDAATEYHLGRRALVDDGLMRQMGVGVGDSIKVGLSTFAIAGRLESIPGEAGVFGLVAPRVFIPMSYLPETGLIQRGSQVNYRVFFALDAAAVDNLVNGFKPDLERQRVSVETVATRRARMGRALGNLYRFLNLVSFIALVLGGVGVGSSVHAYVKQKFPTVAVLRCLGAEARQAGLVYLSQAAAMGFVGSVIGAALGVAILWLFPLVLADLLPLELELSVSLVSIAQGVAVGLGVALVFALLPLLNLRRVSPLLALRAAVDEDTPIREPLRWLVYAAIAVMMVVFAVMNSTRPVIGVGLAGAVGVAFGALALVGYGITRFSKRFFPHTWSYVWRQGLANLFRPQNQTIVLLVGLGLGVFLISTFYLAQSSLLRHIRSVSGDSQPNTVLFDIQTDQRDGVIELLRQLQLPILQEVPLVTMRLQSIRGRDVEAIRQDSTRRRSDWALGWEYRTTYRSQLAETETVVKGEWLGTAGATSILVSLEEGLASDLGVDLGDNIVFDVQGRPLEVQVGSLRRVEWQRVSPNFLVVFPSGVLEEAPQFHVVVTRSESAQLGATLQRRLAQSFPNVSVIDLDLILDAANSLLERAALVIRFVASFSVATGILVLVAVLSNSRYQRLKECVLLKALGATRAQIWRIMLFEYLFLGAFAAVTGLVLALAGNWGLTQFVFEVSYAPAVVPMLVALGAAMALTALFGVGMNRGILDQPPLHALRTEG